MRHGVTRKRSTKRLKHTGNLHSHDNGKLALNKSAQSQSQDLCWGDTSSSLKRPKGRTARTKKFKITPHEINKHKN